MQKKPLIERDVSGEDSHWTAASAATEESGSAAPGSQQKAPEQASRKAGRATAARQLLQLPEAHREYS